MRLLKLVKNVGQCKGIPPCDSKYLFEGYMEGWGTIHAKPSITTLYAYVRVQIEEAFMNLKEAIGRWV